MQNPTYRLYRFRRFTRLQFPHTPERGRAINAVVKATNIDWNSGEPGELYTLEGNLTGRQLRGLKKALGHDRNFAFTLGAREIQAA